VIADPLGFRQIIAVIAVIAVCGDAYRNTASVRVHHAPGSGHAGGVEASGFPFDRWLDAVRMQSRSRTVQAGRAPDAESLPERKFKSGR